MQEAIGFSGRERVDSNLAASPKELLSLMKQLQNQMKLYRSSSGVPVSVLCDAKIFLYLLRILDGMTRWVRSWTDECLLRELSIRDGISLSPGCISSKMLFKAAKMRIPVVVSRHS